MSWSSYIVNINVFIWNGIDVNVYTYFPYKGNKCGENIIAELLGKYPIDDLFPSKIPLTFHGCPIVVLIDLFPPCTLAADLATDDPKKVGFETVLLKNVLQHMNLMPSIMFENGTVLDHNLLNNEFDDLREYLKNEHCQIAIGNLLPKPPFFFEYFDISYPYYSDNYYWYVPKASFGDKWHSLYLIFPITMWLSILAIYLFNILVWFTFTRFVDDIAEIKSMSWCVIETWRSLLQGSFKLPKTSVMRILVITWSSIGFILASAYQSQLLSILTSPIYNHQLSTLQELADSSLHIAYTGHGLDSYKDSTVEVERRIFAKAQFYPPAEFVTFIRNHSSHIAFQGSATRIRYTHLLYYTNPDGTSKIHEIQKSMFKTISCMYTARGYPLLERINNIVRLLLENGLFHKWIKDMDMDKVHDVMSENKTGKLSMHDLKGIFGLLLFGIVLSSLTFIVEIFISYKNKSLTGTV
ncbi:Ionotropic receptor 60a [Carabus blaptoides fortunei]